MAFAQGVRFAFETHGGRKGTAVVLCTRTDINPSHPMKCEWHDANGKHYEWFGLQEFKQYCIIH